MVLDCCQTEFTLYIANCVLIRTLSSDWQYFYSNSTYAPPKMKKFMEKKRFTCYLNCELSSYPRKWGGWFDNFKRCVRIFRGAKSNSRPIKRDWGRNMVKDDHVAWKQLSKSIKDEKLSSPLWFSFPHPHKFLFELGNFWETHFEVFFY
jgi:hypothetical protein